MRKQRSRWNLFHVFTLFLVDYLFWLDNDFIYRLRWLICGSRFFSHCAAVVWLNSSLQLTANPNTHGTLRGGFKAQKGDSWGICSLSAWPERSLHAGTYRPCEVKKPLRLSVPPVHLKRALNFSVCIERPLQSDGISEADTAKILEPDPCLEEVGRASVAPIKLCQLIPAGILRIWFLREKYIRLMTK